MVFDFTNPPNLCGIVNALVEPSKTSNQNKMNLLINNIHSFAVDDERLTHTRCQIILGQDDV